MAELEQVRSALASAEAELEIARQRLSKNPLDPELSATVATALERRKAADVAVQVITERLLDSRLVKREP